MKKMMLVILMCAVLFPGFKDEMVDPQPPGRNCKKQTLPVKETLD